MDNSPTIKFLRLQADHNADIPLPCYMTPGASGMDIYAAIEKDLMLQPGKIALIPTGFADRQMQIKKSGFLEKPDF